MRKHRIFHSSMAAAALVLGTVAAAPGAQSAPTTGVATSTTTTSAAPDINGTNVLGHVQQLESIATANGGHRAFGSTGYLRSLEYVKGKLDAAGYSTQIQTFTYNGKTGRNLIADWPGGDTGNVLMVGAHLDGVTAGPAANDNGSGSAGILEIALEISRVKPAGGKHVRFAWWDAEEIGLVGAEKYVGSLTSTQRSQIDGYYNFDMIGSNNAGYFVYDGDNSDDVGAGPGPAGSGAMERSLVNAFSSMGITSAGTDFDGRSDYQPFIEVGIPAGGTFSGAEGTMTASQASNWGGIAGRAYDTCYHRSCDTVANLNRASIDRHSDAAAKAVWEQAGWTGATPDPDPEPDPTPVECSEYSGSAYLSRGYSDTTNSFSAGAGTHVACLDGPSGADFDLYLQRWNGSSWSTVASGTSSSADEKVSYTGTSGTYRWRVYAYSGSGTASLKWDTP